MAKFERDAAKYAFEIKALKTKLNNYLSIKCPSNEDSKLVAKYILSRTEVIIFASFVL